MNILFLTQRLPFAPNRGDRVRAFHLLREMSSWAAVDVISLVHDREEASHAADLRDRTASVEAVPVTRVRNLARSVLALPGSTPLTHTLLDAPGLEPAIQRVVARHPPDVVFAFCSSMARLAVSRSLAATPLVHDMVDLDSAKWRALSLSSRPPLRWVYRREANTLEAFERLITERAAVTFMTTEKERADLLALSPGRPVIALQNGVDVSAFAPPVPAPVRADPPTVVFCGVMNYEPNASAAIWLATDIWPHIRKAVPTAVLQIVGAAPTARVQALADADRGVVVTGAVPDVRPYLWQGTVAVAPLRIARGVQNKVLEAVAARIPVVITPEVLAGVPTGVLPACAVAAGAEAFADAVVEFLNAPAGARDHKARSASLAGLSWSERLQPLRGFIEGALRR